MPASWLRLDLLLPSASLDAISAELWAAGTAGFEQRACGREVVLEAYFDSRAGWSAQDLDTVAGTCRRLGATVGAIEEVAPRDWLAEYRRRAAPFNLGRGFVVDPGEPDKEVVESGRRRLLRLPARQAFGTGSHESTALIVDWLESQNLEGRSVLDVGTGTGVLALVAMAQGAAKVIAVERDPAAVFMARINQGLNHQTFPLAAATVAALSDDALFDVALINVLPRNIEGDLPRIASLVRPGGTAVFSGLLADLSGAASVRLAGIGFRCRAELRAAEWRALVTERGSS